MQTWKCSPKKLYLCLQIGNFYQYDYFLKINAIVITMAINPTPGLVNVFMSEAGSWNSSLTLPQN